MSEKSLTCCDIRNQHIFITVGGSLIPLFYYLYTLYIFRAFSSEIPQRQVVVITQKSHCSCLQIRFSNPRSIQLDVFPLPEHWWTRDYKKRISLIQRRGIEQRGLRWGLGEVSLVESNGLACQWQWWARGSTYSPIIWALRVCTGQNTCLVLLRLPAMQEGGQIVIGVLLVLLFPLSVEAESLSLLGCLRLLLGLRGRHTWQGGNEKHRSNTPVTYFRSQFLSIWSSCRTNLFSFRRLCCYCCWQPLPWL